MEITSITLSLARPPIAPSLPFSSSQSNFLGTGSTISLLNKAKSQTKSVSFVVGRPRWGTTAEPAKKGLTCNALFGLGVPELVVIAGVAALLFGPKKLPEVGKSIGKTVKSFQQDIIPRVSFFVTQTLCWIQIMLNFLKFFPCIWGVLGGLYIHTNAQILCKIRMLGTGTSN
ncbi:hypothetical protein ERO13_D13G175500v2 [Gossypium hirsutum]|nr:hypothetical protein ERO13_D13G175500v2 [Gossypium hirsutum]